MFFSSSSNARSFNGITGFHSLVATNQMGSNYLNQINKYQHPHYTPNCLNQFNLKKEQMYQKTEPSTPIQGKSAYLK